MLISQNSFTCIVSFNLFPNVKLLPKMTIGIVIILLFEKEKLRRAKQLAIVTQPASQHRDSIAGSQSPEPMSPKPARHSSSLSAHFPWHCLRWSLS